MTVAMIKRLRFLDPMRIILTSRFHITQQILGPMHPEIKQLGILNLNAKFCYSNALIIKPSCSYLAFSVLKPNRSKYSRDVNNLLDTPANFIVQSSVLVEKDLLIKNNLFTEERLTADYIMWLKIFLNLENKYIAKSDKPLVNYYVHGKNISRNTKKKLELQNKLLLMLVNECQSTSTIHYINKKILLNNIIIALAGKKLFSLAIKREVMKLRSLNE